MEWIFGGSDLKHNVPPQYLLQYLTGGVLWDPIGNCWWSLANTFRFEIFGFEFYSLVINDVKLHCFHSFQNVRFGTFLVFACFR
jgi:hypothetical protein